MKLKQAVNDKEFWDDFCEYLDKKIDKIKNHIVQQTDTVVIYRGQGRVMELDFMKLLRNELNAGDNHVRKKNLQG